MEFVHLHTYTTQFPVDELQLTLNSDFQSETKPIAELCHKKRA